ncbi:radical SAM protein [Candidatus Woesearchaeota archaeon]|nr:radical SAM protein [Candidatus Woesearchaeota archaeon]
MDRQIKSTPYFSKKIGMLPAGCRMCVKGEKLVLFITGVCNVGCFYCPLSDNRKSKDVVFANEWDTRIEGHKFGQEQIDILVREAELCGAKGAGITGGDPLLVAERTATTIRELKKRFGRGFHIHLYTTLRNVTAEKLSMLCDAGLDEIRFHPVIWDNSQWNRIALARKFQWAVGVEIPAIPGYGEGARKLIDFLDGRIDFLNLNELEISDNNSSRLSGMGYITKNRLSYAIKGSESAALGLMRYCRSKGCSFDVHYCTSKLKDAIQMARRIKRRAKNIAFPFDTITKEGMISRGSIYLKELAPSFSYRKILGDMDDKKKESLLRKLRDARGMLIKKFDLKKGDMEIDDFKLRLVTSAKITRKSCKELKLMGFVPAVVEEYPTADAIEVDIQLL